MSKIRRIIVNGKVIGRSGRMEDLLVEDLKKLRKPMKRGFKDHLVLSDAIRMIGKLKRYHDREMGLDEVRDLFRLWELPDRRV